MSCSDSNSSYLEVTSARSLALLHVRFSACASKKFLWDLSFDDFCIFFSLDSYIIHSSLGFFLPKNCNNEKMKEKTSWVWCGEVLGQREQDSHAAHPNTFINFDHFDVPNIHDMFRLSSWSHGIWFATDWRLKVVSGYLEWVDLGFIIRFY